MLKRLLELMVSKTAPRISRRLPSGIRQVIPLPISAKINLIAERAAYEHAVGTKLSSFLKPGDIFLDIGAYIGLYTLDASKKVGKNGVVVAVEPSPENFKLLSANVCGLSNVILVNAALWKQDTTLSLFEHRCTTFTRPIKGGRRVPAFALDTLLQKLKLTNPYAAKIDAEGAELLQKLKLTNPYAAKIDAEGAEIQILEGAKTALKRLKWVIVEAHGENVRDVKNRRDEIARILSS
jgi:FkbM family methyltransferase